MTYVQNKRKKYIISDAAVCLASQLIDTGEHSNEFFPNSFLLCFNQGKG